MEKSMILITKLAKEKTRDAVSPRMFQ